MTDRPKRPPLALADAIDWLDPETATALARAHAHALTVAHARRLTLWTCPICWDHVVSAAAPAGWIVASPFARVVSCAACLPPGVSSHE